MRNIKKIMTTKKDKKKCSFSSFYKENYKKILLLPALLFIIAIGLIISTISSEGVPIYRDVSLKGGLSSIVNVDTQDTSNILKNSLEEKFVDNTFTISELLEKNNKIGFIIDTDLIEDDLVQFLDERYNTKYQNI